MDKYMFEERIAKTEYLVEADSFAILKLWQHFSHEMPNKFGSWPRYSWKQQQPSCGIEVGQLAGYPVMLSLEWNVVGGALLCFFSSPSRVVDHEMIRDFLVKHFPNVPRTDAANFPCEHLQRREAPPVILEENARTIGREALERFASQGILTARELELAEVAVMREEEGVEALVLAVRQVRDAGNHFREKVWLPWLKGYYEVSSDRGHLAESDNLTMMVYGLAGRVMVTLRRRSPEKDDQHVSLLGYEGKREFNMYVRGGYGTADALCEMINEAVRLDESLQKNIRPDNEVHLAL
jgi:hypothetical protein